ncbi:hypothetical protein KR76_00057 [Pimelobacter simplex]|uniref:Uncharacterized protein n=1 Tax=Nocardioides simplex TaxID=2045 RepID=A0A0C5XBM1_NOCSI|nr:hypothetical protein KR76_00057 [Pimelobacter simplex]
MRLLDIKISDGTRSGEPVGPAQPRLHARGRSMARVTRETRLVIREPNRGDI